MRKILFYVVAIFLLGACADDVVLQKSVIQKVNNQSFSFDSVTNPSVWNTFTSFEQMMEACQIPESILNKLPTDTLVALCMNHPLAGNFILYNNPIEGAKSVMDRFNGFQELKKRSDAPEKILDFYEKIRLDYTISKPKKNPYTRFRSELKPLQIGFIELSIASMSIPELFSGENLNRLEQINNDKFEQKLQDNKYNNIPALSHSLLVGAQIKISKSIKLSENDNKRLKQFIIGENIRTAHDLSEISRIIYSK